MGRNLDYRGDHVPMCRGAVTGRDHVTTGSDQRSIPGNTCSGRSRAILQPEDGLKNCFLVRFELPLRKVFEGGLNKHRLMVMELSPRTRCTTWVILVVHSGNPSGATGLFSEISVLKARLSSTAPDALIS